MKLINLNRPFLESAAVAGFIAVCWPAMLGKAIQPAHGERATATPEQIAAEDLSSRLREWRGLLENRRFNSGTGGDAFSGMSWTPPPAAVPAPKERSVVAFQYTYMGQLSTEGARTILFLTRGDSLFTLREGDVVEGVFRIEAIKDDYVEVMHLATKTRLTKTFDKLGAPVSFAQAGGALGYGIAVAQAPAPFVSSPSVLRPNEGRVTEARSDSNPAATGASGGRSAATANRPAVSVASTPAAPSAPGSPMQMLPPGKPMEMTNPPSNTVPPQGLNPAYPANLVPPQGAGQ